jgi:teichoic acid transport system permease protein
MIHTGVPQLGVPIATAIQWAIKSVPVMILLYPASLLLGAPISAKWLLLPFVFAMTSISAFSLGLLVVRLISRIPDLINLIQVSMRMMFFMTGVFFSVNIRFEKAPEWIQTIVLHNPSAVLLNLCRSIFLNDIPITLSQTWILGGMTLSFILFGSYMFWRDEVKHG